MKEVDIICNITLVVFSISFVWMVSERIDRVSKELRASRSAFARKALRDALARHKLEERERTHRRGYEQQPVAADEFSVWETEHAWGDE